MRINSRFTETMKCGGATDRLLAIRPKKRKGGIIYCTECAKKRRGLLTK